MIAFLVGLAKAWGFKMVVYATVLGLTMAYALNLRGKLSDAQAQLADFRERLTSLSSESAALQDAITRQNSEIATWQREASVQATRHSEATREAARQRALGASRTREVFLEPLPTGSDALIALLGSEAAKRGSW